MSVESKVWSLASRVATEFNSVRTLLNRALASEVQPDPGGTIRAFDATTYARGAFAVDQNLTVNLTEPTSGGYTAVLQFVFSGSFTLTINDGAAAAVTWDDGTPPTGMVSGTKMKVTLDLTPGESTTASVSWRTDP